MPTYKYQCDKCEVIEFFEYSIQEFLLNKKQKKICLKCNDGVLLHKIGEFNSKINRTSQEIVMDIKENVSKTIDKIHRGDARTIDQIYGEKENPYKKQK